MGAQLDIKNLKYHTPLHVAILDPRGNARKSNYFDVDLLPKLVPKANLIIYDCINRLYESSKSSQENANIIKILIDHIDPCMNIRVRYENKIRGSEMFAFNVLDRYDGKVSLHNKFGNFIAMAVLIMETTRWLPHLPSWEELARSVTHEKQLTTLIASWERHKMQRMSLTRMCEMVIHVRLWQTQGDAQKLPLPPKLVQSISELNKKVHDKVLLQAIFVDFTFSPDF